MAAWPRSKSNSRPQTTRTALSVSTRRSHASGSISLLLLVCATLARRPALHRHSIHGALVIALLGAAGSLMNVVKLGDVFAGTAQRPSAIVVSTIMFVLLVFYIAMGVRSLIVARRSSATTQRF
jgi:hypothetical protein